MCCWLVETSEKHLTGPVGLDVLFVWRCNLPDAVDVPI